MVEIVYKMRSFCIIKSFHGNVFLLKSQEFMFPIGNKDTTKSSWRSGL